MNAGGNPMAGKHVLEPSEPFFRFGYGSMDPIHCVTGSYHMEEGNALDPREFVEAEY